MSLRVVVTDGQYRMTVALVRELLRAGHEVTVTAADNAPPLAFHVRGVTDTVRMPARLSDVTRRETLLDICYKRNVPALFPVGAKTLETVSQFADHFSTVCFTLVSPPRVLEAAGDKPAVAALAASLGIPTPQPYIFEGAEPIEKFARRLPYPVVLKYRCGEKLGLPAERRYTIARNESEFYKRYVTMHDVQPPVLVQELIPGPGWGVEAVMDQNSRPVALFCHRRLREYPLTGGPSTACVSDWSPALVEQAVSLLQTMRFVGIAMVEFKGEPGQERLLEVNPRVWGSYPLAPLSGASMADAYVRAAAGEVLPEATDCAFRTGQVMQFFPNDLMRGLTALKRGKVSPLLTCLRDGLSPRVRGGVRDKEDRPGSWFYVRSLFRRK